MDDDVIKFFKLYDEQLEISKNKKTNDAKELRAEFKKSLTQQMKR
jgi:hypothetical protein